MFSVTIKPEAAAKIIWGKPDAPPRPLCAICHGALPAVPFMLFKADDSAASLCDPCADAALEVKRADL
jgi:hypothetical protein